MRFRKQKKREKKSFYIWGFHILDKWLWLKNKKRSLITYFEDNEIKCIAIYGLGGIGRHLYEELRSQNITISYGIDQRAKDIQDLDLEVKTLDDKLPEVDAVVVTPVSFYEIEKEIYKKMGKEIAVISIEDIVDYCCEE